MRFLSPIVVWSVRHSYILLFGLIWVTTTAAAVTCVTIAIGRGAGPATQKARRSSKRMMRRSRPSSISRRSRWLNN